MMSARPILYWTYEITSYDRHDDLQTYRNSWYETEAEALGDCADHLAELVTLGHTHIVSTVTPTFGAEVTV